ncbi:hypothetical protein PHLCEN_2v2967 [Hermanssonia centrifuga]|uniref:Uncharacterized protein n=1 Tax=Hermanssonia centrifuga TaxID=98765 RepID=A0A2R6REN3_9APHY|nr:hypothetical protein PHLCEN_2v2967 [Hermanssonia centrifuga]
MLAMATLNLAGYTKLGEEAWIDKRDGPGGPMGWLTTECVGQSCVMGYYGYIVANFMADGLLIWRTCIIWDSYLIVLLPCLMYFASTALSIVSVYQIAKPGDNIWSDTTISFGIPYMALSISLNIVLTLLIVARLMYISNTVRTVLGAEHSGTYTFVATAMVESAAPYSITSIFFIILYGRHSNIQNLVLPVLAQIMDDSTILLFPKLEAQFL